MRDEPDLQVLETAAQWYLELRDAAPGAPQHAAHRQWLERDPRHRQAWARVERLQSTFAALPATVARPVLDGERRSRRQLVKALGVLLACGGSGALAWQATPWRDWLAEQRTAVGEQRRLHLDDGSELQLNTDTALNLRFDAHSRTIQLLRGEILVHSATDAARRPLVVYSPHGSVRALGTRFTVRCEDHRTHVGVLQHAVAVTPAKTGVAPQRLEAGQQLWFSSNQLYPSRPLPANADAWSRGLLIVSDWRLAELTAELARYRPGQLSCDPAVADLRLSGAFHLQDIDAVLANIASTLPVRIRYFTRYWARIEAS
ncbi:FecR domain-containing protein [Pseudomonas sp. 8O]|uniref:FecR domain-containing protein n=1 Tax=Pseudomonas sp. 8O TaxID=2653165 RepID=UPI0012F0A0DA|nr:FecR domain-containing protein [Pseudomonas sp. 8O]VXA93634.1 transmembrane signal transducer for ferric citrate transport; KpLE2 phage-like element [Pseudomonas sp. 8O]